MEAVDDLFKKRRLTVIAGPCVIESLESCRDIARFCSETCAKVGLSYVFKASFDKANRTSLYSPRGPGLEAGLDILAQVRRDLNVPVLTDVHEAAQAERVARVVDVLQIPAFLCRQTDLLVAAAKSGKPTNIKKGQFMAPEDMGHSVEKFRASGGVEVAVTERGISFGYHNLVVDMLSLPRMAKSTHAAVVFDATHSIQKPSAAEGTSGGDRREAPILARAAAAVGIDGLFCEVHPQPEKALSDGANSLDFDLFAETVASVAGINTLTRASAEAL